MNNHIDTKDNDMTRPPIPTPHLAPVPTDGGSPLPPLPEPGPLGDAASILTAAGYPVTAMARHPSALRHEDACDWPLCWREAVTTNLDGAYCATHGGAR